MSRFTSAALVACAALAAGAVTPHAADTKGAGQWDAAAAARYLDARMDSWWANAKVLKTGEAETRCISCHTAVPHALARPALRRILGEAAPTAHETRILDTVQARLAFLGNAQPFYDHTEAKKVESRGVEAVLSAFVLTNHDADLGSKVASPATRTAMTQLWKVQRADGAWDWLDFGLEPFETPDALFHGATLAAMAAGTVPGMAASSNAEGKAGVQRLRQYLSANVASQRLFNRTWALLAASRLKGVLSNADRKAIVRDLEARQQADGGWSLADLGTWRWDRTEAPFAGPGQTDHALLSRPDGYATGLVVYALRQAGVAADDPAIVKGRQWLVSHQTPEALGDAAWAPWRAHSLNFDREHGGPKGEPWRRLFMSDLATAFAVLALTS